MGKLEKIFGNNTHFKLIRLYYANGGYFNNIIGLAKMLDERGRIVKYVVRVERRS